MTFDLHAEIAKDRAPRTFERAVNRLREAEAEAAEIDIHAPGLREAIARSQLARAKAQLENVLAAWQPYEVQ